MLDQTLTGRRTIAGWLVAALVCLHRSLRQALLHRGNILEL